VAGTSGACGRAISRLITSQVLIMIRRRGLIDAQASWPRVPWNRAMAVVQLNPEKSAFWPAPQKWWHGVRKEEVEVLAGKKTETRRNDSPHVTFPGNTLVSLLTRADLLCINPYRARTR